MTLLSDIPQAAPLLRLLSVVGADGAEVPLRRLPLHLLRGGTCDTGPGPLDEDTVAASVNALAVHGLVTLTETGGERALRTHPLIGETTRATLGGHAAAVADDAARLLGHQRHCDLAMEEAAYRALVEVRTTALGPDRPDTLDAEVGRARRGIEQGDAAAAEAELSRLARRAADALGGHHPVSLRTLHHRGDALISLDRLDEADCHFRDLLAACTRFLGDDAPSTHEARHQLAVVAMRRNDWHTAAAELEAVVAYRSGAADVDPQRVLFARVNHCYARLRTGERDAAEEGLRLLIAEAGQDAGTEEPAVTLARLYLAVSRMECGQDADDEAADVLRRTERRLGADHADLAAMRRLLDDARTAGGRGD